MMDSDDAHWEDVFAIKELKGIEKNGHPLIREVPVTMDEDLNELEKLVIEIAYA